MSYYQFNKKEVLQKAKERYSNAKPEEYYSKNKNLSNEEKDKIKEYQRERYEQLIKIK